MIMYNTKTLILTGTDNCMGHIPAGDRHTADAWPTPDHLEKFIKVALLRLRQPHIPVVFF